MIRFLLLCMAMQGHYYYNITVDECFLVYLLGWGFFWWGWCYNRWLDLHPEYWHPNYAKKNRVSGKALARGAALTGLAILPFATVLKRSKKYK